MFSSIETGQPCKQAVGCGLRTSTYFTAVLLHPYGCACIHKEQNNNEETKSYQHAKHHKFSPEPIQQHHRWLPLCLPRVLHFGGSEGGRMCRWTQSMSGCGLLVEEECEGDQERKMPLGKNPAPVKQLACVSHVLQMSYTHIHPRWSRISSITWSWYRWMFGPLEHPLVDWVSQVLRLAMFVLVSCSLIVVVSKYLIYQMCLDKGCLVRQRGLAVMYCITVVDIFKVSTRNIH